MKIKKKSPKQTQDISDYMAETPRFDADWYAMMEAFSRKHKKKNRTISI